MPSFKVTPEVITEISASLNLPQDSVHILQNIYRSKISRTIKQHYLAHIIRTMEDVLRKLPNNEMFRIICSPVGKKSKNIGLASAHYYKGRFFAVYYHPGTKERQLRIMLAHELGHLFLLELVNTKLGRNYTEKTQLEPASTIMGIFAILDKNEFYHNGTTPFKHISVSEVLHDFRLLHNRDHNINNLS